MNVYISRTFIEFRIIFDDYLINNKRPQIMYSSPFCYVSKPNVSKPNMI